MLFISMQELFVLSPETHIIDHSMDATMISWAPVNILWLSQLCPYQDNHTSHWKLNCGTKEETQFLGLEVFS